MDDNSDVTVLELASVGELVGAFSPVNHKGLDQG